MILPNQLHLTSLSHCVLEVFEDMPIVVPSSASVLTKSLVELGCLTILSGPMLYVHLIASNYGPFERGYFCDDQSIKHPYTEVFNFLNGIILRSVSLRNKLFQWRFVLLFGSLSTPFSLCWSRLSPGP